MYINTAQLCMAEWTGTSVDYTKLSSSKVPCYHLCNPPDHSCARPYLLKLDDSGSLAHSLSFLPGRTKFRLHLLEWVSTQGLLVAMARVAPLALVDMRGFLISFPISFSFFLSGN